MEKNALYPNLKGKPLDYSKKENWMVINHNSQKVDVFYLYPTAVGNECQDVIGEIDDVVKANSKLGYEKGASCFSEYTNVFVPYYRQMSFFRAYQIHEYEGFIDQIYNSLVRTDVYAALDYFFEHFNNGRPYILSGISQGSYCLDIILSEYMKLHPDYYKRMVACYLIGAGINDEYLKRNPHVKMAKGENDIGVVISWNSEAPDGQKNNMLLRKDAYCINPVTYSHHLRTNIL